MQTETAAPRYRELDTWPIADIVGALWEGQLAAVAACQPVLKTIAAAIEPTAKRLEEGDGRLIYVGAGSAGLIAALDALDLETTFSWPRQRLALLLASGLDLTGGLQSGNEDRADLGLEQARALAIGKDDVVIGVSASGASPYTVAVVEEAGRCGALTVAVASNDGSPLVRNALYAIVVETGAEVVAGSTRLGAGTAQKTILNLFSTALMVRLGRVYGNLMIEMRPENEKLQHRCASMVREIAGVSAEEAAQALSRYGTVKRAALGLAGIDEPDIDPLLRRNRNNLRRALNEAGSRINREAP